MKKKKYISEIPHLMKEWDWEANTDLDPTKLTIGSNKKAWWKCSKCNHHWQAMIESRGLNCRGCPVCSNRICISGKNDLATTHPYLLKEWHPTKNGTLTPRQVTFGSGKKVWWICSKGHTYLQRVVQRTSGKQGCPVCAKVRQGKTFVKHRIERQGSLAQIRPDLANEWHPTKNGTLTPYEVTVGSSKKVWWMCPLGHEYQTTVEARKRTNCPICNLRQSTSFPEQAIFYYIKKLWPDSVNKYKDCFMNGMEFDIYIPKLKLAIEYDGARWHQTNSEHKRELKKYKFCKENNIFLYRVKEKNGKKWNDVGDKIYNIPKRVGNGFSELKNVISSIIEEIDSTIFLDIDLIRDKYKIQKNYLSKIDNSLAKLRPDIADKWNYKKNGNLTPDMFSVSSSEVVWWKCDCGKEWKRSIQGMTQNINGCPVCSKIQRGKTFTKNRVKERGSLAEKRPDLIEEWHTTKNGDLTPYDVTIGSHKKVWWKCSKCDHEWTTKVEDRGIGHQGCPICSKIQQGKSFTKHLVKQKGSLAEKRPDLIEEWYTTKNGDLTPYDVTIGSDKRVWWKCSKCRYAWEAVIRQRVKGFGKCPKCAKKKPKKQLDFDFK